MFLRISKLPNCIGDGITPLDAHVAQAPMRPTTMGVDHETKQASQISCLLSPESWDIGHNKILKLCIA